MIPLTVNRQELAEQDRQSDYRWAARLLADAAALVKEAQGLYETWQDHDALGATDDIIIELEGIA